MLIDPYRFASGEATNSYDDAVSADSPVAYWKLDGTSGPVVDEQGNHDGTNSGATRGAAGLFGQSDGSFNFDGVDDVVVVPWHTDLNGATFSVELWVHPVGWGDSGGPRAVSSLVSGAAAGWDVFLFDTHQSIFFNLGDGGSNSIDAGSSAIALDSTYHVVGTYDGTTARLYLNGTEVASGALDYTPNGDTDMRIGDRAFGDNRHFEGRIDNVAVYDSVLSASRVSAHYAARST